MQGIFPGNCRDSIKSFASLHVRRNLVYPRLRSTIDSSTDRDSENTKGDCPPRDTLNTFKFKTPRLHLTDKFWEASRRMTSHPLETSCQLVSESLPCLNRRHSIDSFATEVARPTITATAANKQKHQEAKFRRLERTGEPDNSMCPGDFGQKYESS